VSFLEILEEFRDLSLQEWNFKEILNNKLLALLNSRRGTIKWVKLGDEGNQIFHAMQQLSIEKII